MTDKFMVFDVESIGLHGEVFAAWLPESWSWWAKLDKHNTPPTLPQNK